jgi:hypothetical protein
MLPLPQDIHRLSTSEVYHGRVMVLVYLMIAFCNKRPRMQKPFEPTRKLLYTWKRHICKVVRSMPVCPEHGTVLAETHRDYTSVPFTYSHPISFWRIERCPRAESAYLHNFSSLEPQSSEHKTKLCQSRCNYERPDSNPLYILLDVCFRHITFHIL